jgi:hypothetical protein
MRKCNKRTAFMVMKVKQLIATLCLQLGTASLHKSLATVCTQRKQRDQTKGDSEKQNRA